MAWLWSTLMIWIFMGAHEAHSFSAACSVKGQVAAAAKSNAPLKVTVYVADGGKENVLITTTTDQEGRYSVGYSYSTKHALGPKNARLKVKAESSDGKVVGEGFTPEETLANRKNCQHKVDL